MHYSVEVGQVGPGKEVALLKAIREVGKGRPGLLGAGTMLSLKEAKSICQYLEKHAPCVLMAGVDRELADRAVALFQQAGTPSQIRETEIAHPLFLRPQVVGNV